MDVYGLIYERGLVGALKYANSIETSNPLFAEKIDSAIEELVILSGMTTQKSFIKTAQPLIPEDNQGDAPKKISSNETILQKQLEEYDLLKETYFKQRAALNLRKDQTYTLDENLLEQCFAYLSSIGKLPYLSFLVRQGYSIRQFSMGLALIKEGYNVAYGAKKAFEEFDNALIEFNQQQKSAAEVIEKFKKLKNTPYENYFKKAFEKIKLSNNKGSIYINLFDVFKDANSINPIFKNQIEDLAKKFRGKQYADFRKELQELLDLSAGKSHSELITMLRNLDDHNAEQWNKGIKTGLAGITDFEKDYYKTLAKYDTNQYTKAMTAFENNLEAAASNASKTKNLLGKEVSKNKITGMVEDVLTKSSQLKWLKNMPVQSIMKVLGPAMNVFTIWTDLSSLYQEYKTSGVTPGFICRILASIANIVSMFPATWAIGAILSLAINYGCKFLDESTAKNKREDKATELGVIKDYQRNDAKAAEIFEQATQNVQFTDLDPKDQILLKELFAEKNQKQINGDLFRQIRAEMQKNINTGNLESPFKTYAIFLDEMMNLKKAIEDPNASIQWKVPLDNKSKIFDEPKVDTQKLAPAQ